VRPRAVALLETALACADGAAVRRYVPTLVPALCKAAADADSRVALGATRCCALLGGCTPPGVWLPLALEHVAPEQPSAARAAAARALAALLEASADAAVTPAHEAAVAAALDAGAQLHEEGTELHAAFERVRALAAARAGVAS
jgi:hypothetical protein